MTHYALLAALLVRLEQRDADVAALKAAAAARPKPQPRMLRALSVPGPPRPRAVYASAAEPSAAPLMSPPTSALLTSVRAAAPFTPCDEVSALSVPGPVPGPQWPRPASGELPDQDAVPAVSLTSPRETGSSDPCTPSKELVPPRAPKHHATAAKGVPSTTGGERGARDPASACKRLCMEKDASVSEAGSTDRCPELAPVVPEGQLSRAVTVRPSGEVHGDDEAREHDGVSAGRGADLLDRVPSAAGLQLPPAHPQQNWKLLAANAEKPLVMCADCAMPPTPEKHALVQVVSTFLAEVLELPLQQ